jgi:hypothetical protein
MTSFAVELVDSIIDMPGRFADVVTAGGSIQPVAVALVALGGLFIAASVGAFGYLTLGALLDLVTPEISRKPPNREAR